MRRNLFASLMIAAAAWAAESGAELFQKALTAERAAGNLEEAIKLYQRVAKEFASDRALAAKALVQEARCYEKLGKDNAVRIYEQVAREYKDQPEPSATANARLVALKLGDRIRHEINRGGFRRADRDVPAHQALQGLDLIPDPFEIAQRAPDVVGEGFARGRQAHAALQPIEQARPDVLLEVENAPVERGGGDAQGFRGAADGFMTDDRVEIDVEARRADPNLGPRRGWFPFRSTWGFEL